MQGTKRNIKTFSKEEYRQFFENLAKSLQINTWQDWYRVKATSISKGGGKQLLKSAGDISLALKKVSFTSI